MTGGTARRAAVIGLQIAAPAVVRPRRAAGIAAREGLPVAGLRGEVSVATIVEIAAVIVGRGRIVAGGRARSSREAAIGIAIPVSRGSTGTSGRRSRPRIG